MSAHEDNHRERESTANFLETNFLHQAERHFDHVNAVSHGMRNLLMLSTNQDCKDHKVIVMRAFNKMHDRLEKIRKLEATHPEFKKEITKRGEEFMEAHKEAVNGCVKLKSLHTEIQKHHHEQFIPAVVKIQCVARRKHFNQRVAKRVRSKKNKTLLRVASKKILAANKGPAKAKELKMRVELLKTMCRGEHIDEVESLLQNYLLRIRREMQNVQVKAVAHKYIKDMHQLEARTRAVTLLTNVELGHLKSFRNPSKDVLHIIRAMLLCLGESESDLTDWVKCKVVLNKTGKFSLIRRMRDFESQPLKAAKMTKVQDELILALEEMENNPKLKLILDPSFEKVEEHAEVISKNAGKAVAVIYLWGRHVCHCVTDLREEARQQLREASSPSSATAMGPKLASATVLPKLVSKTDSWSKKSSGASRSTKLVNRGKSFKDRMQQIRTEDEEADVDELLEQLL